MVLWYEDHMYKWLHSLYKGAREQRLALADAENKQLKAAAKASKGGKKKKAKKKTSHIFTGVSPLWSRCMPHMEMARGLLRVRRRRCQAWAAPVGAH